MNVFDLHTLLNSGTLLVDPAPVQAWLKEGGPALGRVQSFGSAYLCASLLEVSPDFPTDAVKLTADAQSDDPGAVAYAAQFARDSQSDAAAAPRSIIYCTHAMLAVDIRQRLTRSRASLHAQSGSTRTALKAGDDRFDVQSYLQELDELALLATELDVGILPPWQYLIVDEAHLFETNIANMLSSDISLSSYLRHLRVLADAGIITKTGLNEAKQAINAIVEHSRAGAAVNLGRDSKTVMLLRSNLQALANVFLCRRNTKADHPLLRQVQFQARSIMTGLHAVIRPTGIRASLSFSPIRSLPRFQMGRQSLRRELSFLWGTCDGAACVSATLYLRRLDKDSATYTASGLNRLAPLMAPVLQGRSPERQLPGSRQAAQLPAHPWQFHCCPTGRRQRCGVCRIDPPARRSSLATRPSHQRLPLAHGPHSLGRRGSVWRWPR